MSEFVPLTAVGFGVFDRCWRPSEALPAVASSTPAARPIRGSPDVTGYCWAEAVVAADPARTTVPKIAPIRRRDTRRPGRTDVASCDIAMKTPLMDLAAPRWARSPLAKRYLHVLLIRNRSRYERVI